MITPTYLDVLKTSRAQNPYWGVGGARHAPVVIAALEELGLKSASILDYGSGVGTFANAIRQLAGKRFFVSNYDPSMPQWRELPAGPFDAVVCTHVLEHVEPKCLGATLAEIHARANRLAYIEVPFGPAKELLSDGRNAHLTQESEEYWASRLAEVFDGREGWTARAKLNTLGSQATFWLERPARSAPPPSPKM